MLKKLKDFAKILAHKSVRHRVLSASNELSFRLLLALFPFIMLCFSILGFLNINSETFLDYISDAVPEALLDIVSVFALEIMETRSLGLVSLSLFIALFSASSGFYAVIRGVNKSYDYEESRHIVVVRLLSVFLVFVFILAIASAIAVVAVNINIVYTLFSDILLSRYVMFIATFFANAISLGMLFFTTMVIYKVASCKKVRFISVLPGAVAAVVCWVLATKLFSVYVANFANYSNIYGSIGGIIILMIWINIISAAFLFGSEINSLLDVSK
ncbi:MAG: YihY/virulence factor BrkB family protein [Defluviitaleaceae bacterium]|nr:YihY/virulence factor BrkB family protein [Defluviitaleaceae bacterium]